MMPGKVKDPLTVTIIKEIQKQSALWDTTSPQNHMPSARKDAWTSVASVAGLPAAQCKVVWKNVRAAHQTHARRGLSTSNENRQPFLYHEELQFWSVDENSAQSILSTRKDHVQKASRGPLKTIMSSTPLSFGSIRNMLEKDERDKKENFEDKPKLSPILEESSHCLPDEKNILPSQESHSMKVWRAKQTAVKRKADNAGDIEEVVKTIVPPSPVKVDSHTLMSASLAKLFKKLPPQKGFSLMIDFIGKLDNAEANCNYDIYSESTNCDNSSKNNDVSTDNDDGDEKSSNSMEDYVTNILHNDDNAIIKSAYSITLRRRDLYTLMGNNWVNDQVVNFYLQLIQNRGQREGYPSVKVMSSFVYPALVSKDHTLVTEWNKNMPEMFNYEYCLVPIHHNDHWSLVIINVKFRLIEYFDSLIIGSKACFPTVTDFIRKTTKNEIWVTNFIEDRPLQDNGYDCGVFVLAYAEHFTRPVHPITFSQADVQNLRIQVAYEIAMGDLLH